MIYLQYFKAISIKISEHHEANPGFNPGPQWSRQAVSMCSSGSEHYLFLNGVATNHVFGVWLGTQEFKSI